MTQRSAGVLFYRINGAEAEVLLVHPGGPFWRKKEVGAWQIPKGLIAPEERALDAARREVAEELGLQLEGEPFRLGEVQQAGGKLVEAFALEQQIDLDAIQSNVFEMEWPPRSGKRQSFLEVDRARWFTIPDATIMMLASQRPLLALVADFLRNPREMDVPR